MCRRRLLALMLGLLIVPSSSAAAAGGVGLPLISISDARVVEGDSLTTRARFSLTAAGPVCAPVSVEYTTLDASASSIEGDFAAVTGIATLVPDPPRYVTSWTEGGTGQLRRIIVGRNDDLYAIDALSCRVLQFDRNLALIRSWGTAGSGPGEFTDPTSIAQAPDGSVFVTDNGNHRLQKFSSAGNFLEEWGSEGSGPGQFDFFLLSIAIDAAGNVYVSDRALDGLTGRIQKFDGLGNFITQWSTAGARPVGLAVGSNGNVYANVWDPNGTVAHIEVFAPDGTPVTVWNSAATAGGLRGGSRFTFDGCGRVYISEIDRVVVVSEDGTFVAEWPLETPTRRLKFLSAMGVDATGRLFTAQDGSPDVYAFAISQSGTIDVQVAGDASFEADEAFLLLLSNPQNALISDGAGDGIIANDDADVGPNLISNPSLDTSLAGWGPVAEASVTLTAEGHDDASAALVTAPLDTVDTFGFNDSPDVVTSTVAQGARYRFTAWVKLASGSGSARLKVREYSNGVQQNLRVSSPLRLDGTWRPIVISAFAVYAGSHLDMQVVMDPDAPGAAFLVDDLVAQRLYGDVPPILTVPRSVTRNWTQTMSLPIVARDPDGDEIHSLTADLSQLPGGSGARFTGPSDQSAATFRWEPGLNAKRREPYQVAIRAQNSFEVRDTITIHVPDNVVVNPSFLDGIEGWNGNQGARLDWVSPGRTDGHALRATNVLGFSNFGVTDSPNWSYSPVGATVLEASAWVRSPNGGGPVWLWFREYKGDSLIYSETSERVPITSEWRQLRWTYQSRRPDIPEKTTIDFLVMMASNQLGAATGTDTHIGGDQLEVDDVSIVYQSIPPILAAPEIVTPDRLQLVSPNPMRTAGTLRFATTRPGPLRAQILDLSGRVLRTLADERDAPAGERSYRLLTRDAHGRAMAPGVYFYRVATIDGVRSGRFVVLQ